MTRFCSRRARRSRRVGDYQTSSNLIRTMGRPRSWRRQVARRLRADELPEAEVLARDRNLLAGVVDDLDEAADRRPALVQLSGRVQVARPEPVRRHTARAGANRLHERVDSALVLIRGVDEGLDAHVVPLLRAVKQFVERALWCHVGILTAAEDLVRAVRGRLDVRLVEGVDAQDGARDRGRELPAEELGPEVVRVAELDLGPLAVRSGRRLARGGNETLAVLPRRLCDELLGPQAEAAGGVLDADLVAPHLPAVSEPQAELEPGVVPARRGTPRPSHAHACGCARRRRRSAPRPRGRKPTGPNSGRRSPARRGKPRGMHAPARAPRDPNRDR